MRVALDTNVVAYAEGVNGADRKAAALKVLRALPQHDTILPAQVLGELYHVLVRKAARAPTDARAAILSWRDAFAVADTSSDVVAAALDLAAEHQFSIWDAVILSAAADSACRLLLSEDLHEGFTWRGVTVTNPFARSPHPLLAPLLV